MTHVPSYASIVAAGHKMTAGMFDLPVTVEEKIDGSFVAFGMFDDGLAVRSRNQDIDLAAAGMFQPGVDEIVKRQDRLEPGWIYYGEYLSKPKHNTLAYDRVPNGHIVLWDVDKGIQTFLDWHLKACEADRLDFDVAPLLYLGRVDSTDTLTGLLHRDSLLGGQKIEGVVAKCYDLFTAEKKIAVCKVVSDRFKEKHGADWKGRNPSRVDIVDSIIASLRSEARWAKGVQHMAEAGTLLDAPQDIGPLLREVQSDILAEEGEAIAELLLKHFWPAISKGAVAGLPQWYKDKLIADVFEVAA